ncbi:immunity 49 family protein [Natronobeatus ordinarius]|uniref:immunity 49 family protein n=1 Tax=Natronobeatus ordinarius TaxID=2963433 RepID=UPI0020CBA73F|nr:immunity 49 family protein [Natronobeatus ordinarius]
MVPDLTEKQRARLEELLENRLSRIEKRKERLESGTVADKQRPTAEYGLAGTYKSTAIVYVYQSQISRAREHFRFAAQHYLTAAKEARQCECELNTFRRIPLTLTEGVYVSALCGDDLLKETASEEILALDPAELPAHEYIEEPIDFPVDKFYASKCIAGSVLDRVADDHIDRLIDINEGKEGPHQLYGQAITDFASGIGVENTTLLKRGVELMLEYHDRQRHEDNVIDLIMALEATALLTIARQNGYGITVDSEFTPEDLVDAIV